MNIFVGSEKNPTFLVEINKNITVYKPDKYSKNEDKLTLADKYKLISDYMPPEPELDSIIYHYII